MRNSFLILCTALCLLATSVRAQQTLSSINGTVTDSSGAALRNAEVTVTEEQTSLTRTTKSSKEGYFQILNLPVGTYTVRVAEEGFESEALPHIAVVETHASTVKAALKVGKVNETVTVSMNPLLNQTDATNGFTLSHDEIQQIPLATGSFTQLAVLTPGVSAQLLSGIGTNAGLGNQAIWANGQRDTSNSFRVNGVDTTNLFNGKSSSQTASNRVSVGIGQGSSQGGQSQTNISVYGSNGNGLATPPPEMIQEMSVKTSMYDAQSGTNSGLHIELSTAAGTNKYHGQAYGTHATNFINAAPYFMKQDSGPLIHSVPLSQVNPQLHKELMGGSVGGPILRNKLFFYTGYQYMHDSDTYKGFSRLTVPVGLTDNRSTAGLQSAEDSYLIGTACNANYGTGKPYADLTSCWNAQSILAANKFTGTIDPVAAQIFNQKLPNGQFLIPSVQNTDPSQIYGGSNVYLPGSSLMSTNMAVGSLDYDVNQHDRMSAKYFFQHAPNFSPYTISNTGGFPEMEDSGAQVASLSNSLTLGSRINWQQLFGYSRQKVYSGFEPEITGNMGIGLPSGNLPGLSLNDLAYSAGGSVTTGPNSNFVDAGYFQNRWSPSTSLFYTLGKHSLAFGTNYSYTQLNVRNNRGGNGIVSTQNLTTLLAGTVNTSSYLAGNANRYYRTNEIGSYAQDKWQILPNLSITAGIRYDYNGPFTEKYGNMFTFDPTRYSVTASAVTNAGFVVAGNNKLAPTAGVSNSTLTGRQWGIGPRVGFAFTPSHFNNKIVIRAGSGFYYDRGELFSYLSQPAGSSIGGPFGVTEAPPLVDYVTGTGAKSLENPLGTAVIPVPSANPSGFTATLPTANQIKSTCQAVPLQTNGSTCGVTPLNFGAYNMANKLPYSINYSLDLQWQPTNTIAVTLSYVGNVTRHGVIPVPFNEPGVATPGNPINGETSSYGYQVLNAASPVATKNASGKAMTAYNSISTEPYNTYDGGNTDLRVPYVGYSPNAALFTAAGNGSYNSFQSQIVKKMTHHLQATVAYTWSHALDEQSDVGLFFTGDNPNKLRDSYASADFDQTHTLTSAFLFTSPDLVAKSGLAGKLINGWNLAGIVTAESGQPYSLYEYNGAVGSLYFGPYPTLANPVIGIKDGAHPKSALTGHLGASIVAETSTSAGYVGAINVSQLAVNYIQPGNKGIPACKAGEPCDYFETDFTPGQRNIFRQSFQKDANLELNKTLAIKERFNILYSFDVFNVTNTPSFDNPSNSASVGKKYVNGTGTSPYSANGQVVSTAGQETTVTQPALYKMPTTNLDGSTSSTFGAVRNTIGSARTIEMSLHLNF